MAKYREVARFRCANDNIFPLNFLKAPCDFSFLFFSFIKIQRKYDVIHKVSSKFSRPHTKNVRNFKKFVWICHACGLYNCSPYSSYQHLITAQAAKWYNRYNSIMQLWSLVSVKNSWSPTFVFFHECVFEQYIFEHKFG